MKTATPFSFFPLLLACVLLATSQVGLAQTSLGRPSTLPLNRAFEQNYANWRGATVATPARTQAATVTGQVPLNPSFWYQLNSHGDGVSATEGFQQLSNGVLNEKVNLGYGKVLPVQDAYFNQPTYDSYYEFKNLTNVVLTSIRLNSGQEAAGSCTIYAKESATAAPVLLATYTYGGYLNWQDVTLPSVPAQYLIIRSSGVFPAELEVYGSYQQAPAVALAPQRPIRLGDEFGINSFVWDFMQSTENPNVREQVYEPKMELMQAFTQYRDYVDWEKIEPNPGVYTFNPTQSGAWNYDVMYKRLKEEGKVVLACLKTLPAWFLEANYPADLRDSENVPAPYHANRLEPSAYVLQAKMAFQFAARYGSNKNVDPNLLSGVLTGYIYPNAPEAGSRTREIGLDYIKYIECENERDKWWKGRKAYQTAREYAANLSAFYDGHKNSLGAGVGVKSADPNMQVVIGGIASTDTDYIRGIIDWCKEFRGYKSDGSVDLCFDVINYHAYANNSGLSQDGSSTRGAAPEVAGSSKHARAFAQLAREYNVEVWITEAGYDLNEHSSLHAPAIGSKTALQVQADWILRTALLYAREGIHRLFLYQTYDRSLASWGQFDSSGLLDEQTQTRKPAADFLFQANKLLGQYTYKETLNSNPLVDRYELNGRSAYVLVVPDEQGRTANYTLNVGTTGPVKIYTPIAGQDSMAVQTVTSAGGSLTLTVTETPLFVVPSTGGTPELALSQNPSFEDDHAAVQSPVGWQTWWGVAGTDADADYTEPTGGGHTGTYHGTHRKNSPYEVYTYQMVSNLPTGLYTLRGWVKSSGAQTYAILLAKNYGGEQVGVDASVATVGGEGGAWRYVEVPNIQVTNGQCEIGAYSVAPAGAWFYFDDVTLVSQGAGVSRNAPPATKVPVIQPELQLYPNPAHEQVALSRTFAQAGQVQVRLLTVTGKQIAHYQQQVQPGPNTWTVPTESVPAGLYILQVQEGQHISSQRVSILHH